jgi:hypothetical protein
MKKIAKPTLAQTHRKLAREWHLAKNMPRTPRDVTAGSNKKVWWMCKKGHEWTAAICDRSSGKGCPYCAGRKVTPDTCLQAINPELAKEWHPTKNAPLTPKDVMPSVRKKVWWTCRKGHEWAAVIYNRNNGCGCPICAMRRVDKGNSLQTLRPDLAREWHPTRNAPLMPGDIVPGSVKKMWWLCRKGHEWQIPVRARNKGRGCPFCAGKKVGKDNCLRTVNPGLARQWHPTRNAPLTPADVTSRSGKKAWWLCRKGHEWTAVIASRTGGNGCPYCAGQWVNEENCLQAVRPNLAKEWHSRKNTPLTPKDVMPFSSRKVWWACRKGHEWEDSLSHRSGGRGCPYCSGRRPDRKNSLEIKGPRLTREWHPAKNASWTPKDVLPYSRRQIWWKCEKGHELREPVIDRYKRGGCTVCLLKKKAPRLFDSFEGPT